MTDRLVVGLTGGIGVGKSTVAALLAAHGAHVIDVDGLGRDVLEPDGGAYAAVVESFGESILAPDATIDRAALAALVFGGENRLAELEAISHPAINALLERRLLDRADPVTVLDMAVLVESRLGRRGDGTPIYDRVIVVETPLDLRIARLIDRGMTEADARARMAAQASDHERRRHADLIVTNDADLDRLASRVDDVWCTIEAWQTQQA